MPHANWLGEGDLDSHSDFGARHRNACLMFISVTAICVFVDQRALLAGITLGVAAIVWRPRNPPVSRFK